MAPLHTPHRTRRAEPLRHPPSPFTPPARTGYIQLPLAKNARKSEI